MTRRTATIRRTTQWLAVLSLVLATTGCGGGFSVYDLPLPGGAALGPHPIRVTASFADVLDLVPQSGVEVNDVAVGRVTRIDLAPDGRTAVATLAVDGDVVLPANAVARLRQASILGEKFVELAAPPDAAPAGRLADGAVIPLDRSSLTPQIEEVFGALSLLLNGGGVAQVQNISHQLNLALGGKESAARSLLSSLDTLMTGLDQQRGEITRALDSVQKLSATLDAHRADITTTLTGLTPGIKVLDDQKAALTGLLDSLDGLSSVAVGTVEKSQDDLVADLKALAPLLRRLADSGAALPQAMELLFTFPFPDAALDTIRGDYLNTFVRKGN
ncbi:MCE family protein [Amycolatopsis sp. PS_44_ISF1]|uniref:MCE family protein n=1 Tax=Amycolatopsis sp. PS_44_ISF1 TaxID=2974917 RepID=UPI0028DE1C6D|nr:MCE family protein [Amycolatopsis sp. PS_44_ISF1]MDT8912970.1 MCE family protein [Amycolatopsis sp. PS_44_ISF1]